MKWQSTVLWALGGLLFAMLVGSGCGSRYIVGFSEASAERQNGEVTFVGTLKCELVGVPDCGTSQCITARWFRQEDANRIGDATSSDVAADTSHAGDVEGAGDVSHGGDVVVPDDVSRDGGDDSRDASPSGDTSEDASQGGANDTGIEEADADGSPDAGGEKEVGNPDLQYTIDENADPYASAEGCHNGKMKEGDEASIRLTPDEEIPTDEPFVIQGEVTDVKGTDRVGQYRPREVYIESP